MRADEGVISARDVIAGFYQNDYWRDVGFLGQRVNHSKFGDGIIVNIEGRSSHVRVEVNFETEGSRWLMLAYANLQPI